MKITFIVSIITISIITFFACAPATDPTVVEKKTVETVYTTNNFSVEYVTNAVTNITVTTNETEVIMTNSFETAAGDITTFWYMEPMVLSGYTVSNSNFVTGIVYKAFEIGTMAPFFNLGGAARNGFYVSQRLTAPNPWYWEWYVVSTNINIVYDTNITISVATNIIQN